jgi:intracellular multiplication protein IcmD
MLKNGMQIKRSSHKILLWVALGVLCGFVQTAWAVETIGAIATGLTSSFSGLAKLITAASYLAGIGFALAAIMKFKAHKDNPTQIPVGTPIALVFVAAALMFLPTVYTSSGVTVFGSTGTKGSLTGVSSFGS